MIDILVSVGVSGVIGRYLRGGNGVNNTYVEGVYPAAADIDLANVVVSMDGILREMEERLKY